MKQAWVILGLLKRARKGDTKAIAELIVMALTWAAKRSDTDWDDNLLRDIRNVLGQKQSNLI